MKAFKLFAYVLAVVFAAACGGTEDATLPPAFEAQRWESFPVTIFADKKFTSVTADERDLRTAMDFWESKAGKKLFDYQGTWTGEQPFTEIGANGRVLANVVLLLDPWTLGSQAGATMINPPTEINSIPAALIVINPTAVFCSGDCMGAVFWESNPTTSLRNLFTHELGHFLGLPHVNDRGNIMNPQIVFPPVDLEEVKVDEVMFNKLTQ